MFPVQVGSLRAPNGCPCTNVMRIQNLSRSDFWILDTRHCRRTSVRTERKPLEELFLREARFRPPVFPLAARPKIPNAHQ
jgi:hypothetical protein